jgi:CHAT domain-containing protein
MLLTNLPGTEKEIKSIEKFLKSKKWDVKSYLGDLAIKGAVQSVRSPRILHIATHGLFLEDVERGGQEIFGFEEKKMVENPLLRSGLFFTGADNYIKKGEGYISDDENGILTAYEAMNLDLDKTELVVLSACETGLGDIQNGEGVFGLRRAFQQAGAKTIIMSLWAVSDEATQELMSNFYSNWVSGMTKGDAFNKAQQEVRKKYPAPYYWGAFVMVGE